MLAIKLKRVGKKDQATFRIIVAEKRSKMNGRFIEDLGWWNPHSNAFSVNKELVKKWIEYGAQMTESVNNILVKARAIDTKKIAVHQKKKKKKKES